MTKEHRRRAFENSVLRRIFGPRRDEVRGKRVRAQNEELYDLYSSPKNYSSDQIKKNDMTGRKDCTPWS
jgi:hypothetical protein